MKEMDTQDCKLNMSLSTIEIVRKLKSLDISLSYQDGSEVLSAIHFNGEMSENDYSFYFNNYQRILTITLTEWESVSDLMNASTTLSMTLDC